MTAALHPAAVHRPDLRPGRGQDWEWAQCSAFNIWTSPIQGSRPFCPEVADPGSPISCPETLIEWQMVIFGGARSCGLPAAQGLRPQAPAVLPQSCQQGAGSRGIRRPAGARAWWVSAKGVAPRPQRKQAPKWSHGRRAGSWRPNQPPRQSAPNSAGPI